MSDKMSIEMKGTIFVVIGLVGLFLLFMLIIDQTVRSATNESLTRRNEIMKSLGCQIIVGERPDPTCSPVIVGSYFAGRWVCCGSALNSNSK